MSGLEAHLAGMAARNPQRTAFSQGGESLSYGELRARALALAAHLSRLGVTRGERVGIAMRKGLDMPVALHGIWLTGAAFVPLDMSSPPERLAAIARECGIRVIVTAKGDADAASRIAEPAGLSVVLPGDAEGAEGHEPACNEPEDIAYIIFTSGSTGTPKGIVHTHASGQAFAQMWSDLYGLTGEDVFFCTVPLHFDFSLADFLAAPMAGARVELVPEVALRFPASVAKLLESSGATIWSTVPYALIQLCERGAAETRDLSRLRMVIYGGEPLAPGKLATIRAALRAEISNSYGPAEVNQVTEYRVPPDHPPSRPIPLGLATSHAELAQDEDGTLLVAAPSMMRGYWQRPDLDAAAFVLRDGRRFYRTGDVAEPGADGLWRFVGRADRQVKLRGYRIELDEIEQVLGSHPQVSEAAVVVSGQDETLSAFVTPVQGSTPDEAALKEHAARSLPPYAIPARIAIRNEFARTTTGKIDRRALKELPA